MKLIPLTKGLFSMVDDEDYGHLMQWNWHASYSSLTKKFYARRGQYCGGGHYGKMKTILLHRVLTNAPNGLIVDHKDRDPLNNQRSNLRVCTKAENNRNTQSRPKSTSKYCGVCFCQRSQKWHAQIRHQNKTIFLGYYTVETEAAKAFNKAALKYHGQFANLNIIPNEYQDRATRDIFELPNVEANEKG